MFKAIALYIYPANNIYISIYYIKSIYNADNYCTMFIIYNFLNIFNETSF